MVRDIEATKRRIYEAALAEFAEFGMHGTTIDRIAGRAAVNRERVYAYFGDKSHLFTVVIRTELEKIAEAVPLIITGPTDIGDFAGRTFDYQQEHPDLARLVLWEGLADTGSVPEEPGRTELYAGKAATIEAAQRAGVIDDSIDPGTLVFLVIALASYWAAAPQIARMLTTGSSAQANRRAAVVNAAQRMVARSSDERM
ncbi:TetR family transcriptional regulator [Streptomyces sp. NPDC048277]|uniref:TetR family transcriptional regulator n=1 Tax=Streptomyces sp. NPDC048277 TaxID=3155027 RepID=UPI0033F270D5